MTCTTCTKGAFAAALLASTALVAHPAAAQTATWDGSASSDWNDPANWDTNTVPTAADDVVVDETLPSILVEIGAAVNAQAGGLVVGNAAAPVVDQLQIEGGGTLTTTDITQVGVEPYAAGSITVFGAGSQWSTGGDIRLGVEGSGGVLVLNGGVLSGSGDGNLGFQAGSFGIATVDGAGSTWGSAGILAVGRGGEGHLTITNQGQVNNTQGVIGFLSGGTGEATVSDAGSTWTNTQGLNVGFSGAGTLEVLNGGSVTSTEGVLGGFADGSGIVAIYGAGSTWAMTDQLYVGRNGTGVLTIENGGQVNTTAQNFVGYESGSTGDVTVTGAGSAWTASWLSVGELGTGAVTIADGATLATQIGNIGRLSGSHGAVTVTGAGSTWTNTINIFVGNEDGTLDILDGGTVTSTSGFLGAAGGSGSATISGAGSIWSMTDLLSVGGSGAGVLNVENGGQVSSLDTDIGFSSDGTGDVTVTGAGSTLTSTGSLTVGNFGNGTLEIADQGQVNASDSFIGLEQGSQGAVTVTDASWTMGNVLYVGWEGNGTLVVDNGVVTNNSSSIGNNFGAAGAVTVTNGSTWSNSSGLSVGFAGNGELSIDGGSTVTNTDAFVAAANSGVGTIAVSGAGSTWTSSGNLMLGGNGQGALTIADQGVVNVLGEASLGEAPGGDGITTVTGAGSLFSVGGNLFVAEGGDSGVLDIADGGVVDVAGNSTIGFDADAQGSATVTGAGSTWATAGDLIVGLSGNGTLDILDGGTTTSAYGVLGHDPGSSGGVSVSGAGSNWTMTNNLIVGGGDAGVLAIENGGHVTVTVESDVGLFSGVTGDVAVTGAGSSWTTGELNVGVFGTGAVTVADGGTLTSALANIGQLTGSQGEVTVTGAGSTWTGSGSLAVGFDGQGTLTIADGGQFANVGAIIVGRSATGTGDVAVTGANSLATTASQLIVGGEGTGAVTVADGAAIQSNNGLVGLLGGSHGDATVTGVGSTWTVATDFMVGIDGTGSLSIADQGLLDVAGNSFVGYNGTGVGSATVTGAGSTWATGGDIEIGRFGTGALSIEDGGDVTAANGNVGAIAGAGDVTVTGADSLWEMTGSLIVGDLGTGTLNIADGAQVTNAGIAFIGETPLGNGEVYVADASWINGNSLAVGSAGTGVLTLDNATVVNDNARVGAAAGSHGTVVVANGSTWTNGILVVGGGGTGEATIAGGSTVDAGVVFVAQQAGSQGTINIGAAASEAAAAPGTLNTSDVEFGAGTGTLVLNHTSQDYLFAAEVDGPGAIEALAGRTLLPAGGGFTGTATIHDQATLAVDGVLGGTFDVLAGGLLEGSGTVGTVNVAGTIAPGNSIGTLTVAGNYTQAPGSTYEVEIDAVGNSDLIDVAGTATLNGGTVEIVPFPDFAPATPYTILTAAGGVTGTLDGVSMAFSSLFLTPQLTYDANNAFFTVAQSASFDSVALTPNQKAAAAGADSLGGGNELWNAIALLGAQEQAQVAFDAISGEVHASAAGMLIEDSRFVREAVGDRLRASGPGIAPAEPGRFAVWGNAFGSWAEWDGDGNAAAFNRETGGLLMGGDISVGESWRLGLAAGYSSIDFDLDDRASRGSADSYHLAAYAGTGIGKLGLRFGGAYTWHDVETRRTAAFPGFTDPLSADYGAATAQLFGEAGYHFGSARAGFEPFANLAYVNLHTDGFGESGGAAALTASSASQDTFFTTLGLRADALVPLRDFPVRPYGSLGWRHAFGDVTPTTDFGFAGGNAFTIAGVPIAGDAAVIEAGLDLALQPNANFSAGYSGQIGDGFDDHGLEARFEIRF